MVPNLVDDGVIDVAKDSDGFALEDVDKKLFVAGVARRPEDVASSVRDATGAAAKAIMAIGRSV
jgi:quinone-modifying oxidoreductase subunit QmoA